MSLSEKVQEINREISATVERAVADLRQEVSQQLRAGHDEILRRLGEITPELPRSFIPEDLVTTAEQMAEERAEARAEAKAEEIAQAALLSSRQSAEAAEQSVSQRINGARNAALTDVREALANIDRARTQAEILAALLRETGRFSSRAAVLLLRGTELRGWGGHGFGEAEPGIRDLAFPAADGNSWSRLPQGQTAVHLNAAECAELCSRIDAPLPREGVLIPIVLRDRVAAGLYADRLRGGLDAAALQILCYTAAMAIELLPFRERPFTPTLAIEGGPAGEAFSDEPHAEEPAPETPLAAIAAAPEPDQAEPVQSEPSPEETAPDSSPDLSDTMAGAELAAEPAESPVYSDVEIEAEPSVEPNVESEIETEELTAEPEPQAWATPEPEPPVPAFEEPAPVAEPAYEPSPAATVYQPIPVQAFQTAAEPPAQPMSIYSPASSADQTVLMQRSPLREVPPPAATPPPIPQQATREVEPPPAPAPLRSVPTAVEPPPAVAPAGGDAAATPEVRPPSGVEGPGWAFSANRQQAVSPNEEAQHEEARRLARLLVSEIKLYNEEQVEEGRRKRDVYERLREDIDRSRQMYEERVEARILKSTDYFYQELVRILAAGDAKALGI
jgi:hypothetical protein